jgi:hypothetical protein
MESGRLLIAKVGYQLSCEEFLFFMFFWMRVIFMNAPKLILELKASGIHA